MAEIVVHDAKRLKELQELPLERKIMISQTRIIEWYKRNDGNVYVSYSGGKDSTVLLHLVRQIYPDVAVVFSNTGLEYPEIQKFSRDQGATFVTPKMKFNEVITKYGYPLIGKEMAKTIYESRRYKNKDGGELTKVRKQVLGVGNYEDGMYSGKRWEPLAHEVHVKVSDRCCHIMKNNPDYDPLLPEYDGEWKNWNPKKIWVPSKEGLGMGKVFDMVNEIYGKDFYRYE